MPLISLAVHFGDLETHAENRNGTNGGEGKEDGSVASKSIASAATMDSTEDGNLLQRSIVSLGERMDKNETVDPTTLANWLSDILNGIRGYGEVLLPLPPLTPNSQHANSRFDNLNRQTSHSSTKTNRGMGGKAGVDVVESEAIETFLFRHSEPLKGVSPQKMGKGFGGGNPCSNQFNQCRVSNLGSPMNLFGLLNGDNGGGGR